MKRVVACVLMWLLCLGAAFAEEATLEDRLARLFKGAKTTGATLAVARDGEIVYEYHYGYADKASKEAVDAQTYFRTASVTKMVCGVHVMQLVEQGVLHLDESIGDTLGYEVYNRYHPETPVTLRQIMCHTSSLNPMGGYSRNGRTLQSLLDVTGKTWGNWYDYAPGSKYKYSNFGAGIMGSLVEAATGKNINDSITGSLFAPLSMDAALHPTLVGDPQKVAGQYDPTGKKVKDREKLLSGEWDSAVDPDSHYRITVGSLWIRGRDLCRIGMMMAGNGEVDGVRILREETVQAMLQDQQGQPNVTAVTPYGLCVQRVDNLLEDRMLYGHQGLSDGTLCNLYWDEETQFVFALITNGSSVNMNDHIGILSRKVFGLMWEEFGK